MFDDENELRLYEDFLMLARQHPHSKATHYIRELWEHKGVPISSTRLYTLYQPNFHLHLDEELKEAMHIMRYLHKSDFPEQPIPALDKQAIKEVDAYINCLRLDLAQAREHNDPARIAEDISRLEQINQCLIDYFLPNGDIRCLGDVTRSHTRLIFQGVEYFKKCIHPIHPRLVEHIHAHAVIHSECYWSLNPIQHRG